MRLKNELPEMLTLGVPPEDNAEGATEAAAADAPSQTWPYDVSQKLNKERGTTHNRLRIFCVDIEKTP
jgi:hypothetical protein